MTPIRTILGLSFALALAACSRDDPILPGEREDIRAILSDDFVPLVAQADQVDRDVPLELPAASVNENWLQSIASPGTRAVHPALSSSPSLAWSVNIGAGDSRRTRITADPVVADQRIFTLDAASQVSAVSTDGRVLWQRSLVPPGERATDATGGGLAVADGKLFVTSGFGHITALDTETGEQIWQQKLLAATSSPPTVKDGLVYLVAGSQIGWALRADTGRIAWRLEASPNIKNVIGGPAPALTDKYVVFGFGSGELQGAFRQGGLRLWDSQVAGQRQGFSMARVGDITSDPVVVGDRIFVGNHSGRTVAMNLANGERLWTATDGPLNNIWPAGNSVFMVTERNELLRLGMDDGVRIWSKTLPFFVSDRPRRQSEIYAHYGPIIAGSNLILASNDGKMRLFNPESGELRGTVDIPGGATTNPVVAGNTLYVVSRNGNLLAFR